MVATALLKVYRSMNHKKDDFTALIEADLGAEYSRASSPKPYPGSMCRLMLPLIYTVNFPS